MSSNITLSAGVRANLSSLQSTAEMMNTVQQRLATGKKVNSAIDNPVNFFTAASLQSRAGDLSTLLDSVSNAVQTINAADKGITAITKLIEAAKSTAKQALTASAGEVSYAASVAGTAIANDAAVAALTGTLTIQVGSGTTHTVDLAAETTLTGLQDTLEDLNLGTGVTATLNAGAITITSTSSESITIGGTGLTGTGLTAGTTTPTATVTTASSTRTSLQNDFNDLLTQISQLAADASFNGVNLLNGDSLSVVFNEDGSSSMSINGVTFDAAGLGLNAQSGDGFQIDANINAAITALDTATSTLRTQSSTFGSKLSIVQTRQDFTKNLINVLQVGADNLTLADSNEEGANLLALQTRQSLSTSALSMAVQADQNVLRLLQ